MNFEANRKKILADLQRSKSRKKVHSSRPAPNLSVSSENGHPKVPIVLFGKKSPFTINLVHSLSGQCQPTFMDDVDTAVDFISEHSVNHLIIDIDPPSDYHLGINLLTVVKSVSSSVNLFVCAGDVNGSQAQSMQNHGCALLGKPVSIPQLMSYLA